MGLGDATNWPGGTIIAQSVEELGKLIIGEDPFHIEYLYHRMYYALEQIGQTGAVIRGRQRHRDRPVGHRGQGHRAAHLQSHRRTVPGPHPVLQPRVQPGGMRGAGREGRYRHQGVLPRRSDGRTVNELTHPGPLRSGKRSSPWNTCAAAARPWATRWTSAPTWDAGTPRAPRSASATGWKRSACCSTRSPSTRRISTPWPG